MKTGFLDIPQEDFDLHKLSLMTCQYQASLTDLKEYHLSRFLLI